MSDVKVISVETKITYTYLVAKDWMLDDTEQVVTNSLLENHELLANNRLRCTALMSNGTPTSIVEYPSIIRDHDTGTFINFIYEG